MDVVDRGACGTGLRSGGGYGGGCGVDVIKVAGALALAGLCFGIGNTGLAGLDLLLLAAPTIGLSAMLQLNGPVISWTD